jgi:hypothetical protein
MRHRLLTTAMGRMTGKAVVLADLGCEYRDVGVPDFHEFGASGREIGCEGTAGLIAAATDRRTDVPLTAVVS